MPSSTTLSVEVHADVKNGTSCDYHRVVLPLESLKAKVKVPVVWFNRMHSQGPMHLVNARRMGARIVADIDDSPFLGKNHYLYENFTKFETTPRILNDLSLADVITVTTSRLADVIRMALPRANIEVVPNGLPFDKGQFARNAHFDDPYPVVYAAGPSHYDDARLLPTSWPELAFAGEIWHTEWEKIKKLHPQCSYRGARPLDSYMQVYEGHKIAIAPLKPTPFNAGKSNLKMLEAGARGLAFMASEVPPYVDKEDREFVVYAEGKTDWAKKASALLRSHSSLHERAEALARYVRKSYDIKKPNKIRKQIMESFR